MSAYALTGAPGAGKTVLLRALELRGHLVAEEAATDIIALEQALGDAEPWTDPAFVDNIVRLQRLREPSGGFSDRSPVCTLALCRYLGFTPSALLMSEVDRALATYSRTAFFVRHRGVVEPTPARRISFADSLVFERVHEETYREYGFRLVEVPDGTVEERVRAVEQALAAAAVGHPADPAG